MLKKKPQKVKNQGIGSGHFQKLYKNERTFIKLVNRLRVFKENNSKQAEIILGTYTWLNNMKYIYTIYCTNRLNKKQ